MAHGVTNRESSADSQGFALHSAPSTMPAGTLHHGDICMCMCILRTCSHAFQVPPASMIVEHEVAPFQVMTGATLGTEKPDTEIFSTSSRHPPCWALPTFVSSTSRKVFRTQSKAFITLSKVPRSDESDLKLTKRLINVMAQVNVPLEAVLPGYKSHQGCKNT
jgi:hypothetical protein